MRVRTFEIALACGLAFFAYAATRANAQDAQGNSKAETHATSKVPPSEASKTSSSSDSDAGEKAFQTHCSRCHNAPEDLSPRVVRAVVRQMRVRAMLTADDERALVKFLAP
jgi:hypothetical protein